MRISPIVQQDIHVKKDARFFLGLFFFVLFLIAPALIPLVIWLPISTGWQAALSAGLALGLPEVFAIIAVALLGRERFDALMQPIKRLIRRVSPQVVSRRRYLIGLVLLIIPVVDALIFLHSDEWRERFQGQMLVRAIIWNSLIIIGFLVLGGDFWDKFRALFHHRAKAVFPSRPCDSPLPPASDECKPLDGNGSS